MQQCTDAQCARSKHRAREILVHKHTPECKLEWDVRIFRVVLAWAGLRWTHLPHDLIKSPPFVDCL